MSKRLIACLPWDVVCCTAVNLHNTFSHLFWLVVLEIKQHSQNIVSLLRTRKQGLARDDPPSLCCMVCLWEAHLSGTSLSKRDISGLNMDMWILTESMFYKREKIIICIQSNKCSQPCFWEKTCAISTSEKPKHTQVPRSW